MASASNETRALVEQVLHDYLLPLPSLPSSSSGKDRGKGKDKEEREQGVDEEAWTERLLNVMRSLSEGSVNVLIGLSGIKST